MKWNLVGGFVRCNPYGTEIAFRKGLERIGETVNVYDPERSTKIELDPHADATVVFKNLEDKNLREMLKSGFGGKKIIYQVDDLRFPHIKQMMVDMRSVCDYALTFDDSGAGLAKDYGYRKAQKLLLTADNTLYRKIPGMQKDIDVSFIGSMSSGPNHASRMKMVQIVSQIPRIRFITASEIFDIGKICEIYNRSKIVLNHATDVGQRFGEGYGYQCRHFEAGFSGAFVMSNMILNEHCLDEQLGFFYSEESLVDGIRAMLDDKTGLIEFAANSLYEELYKNHLPEHRAREMVKFVESL
jgi:hypothetical protein